MLLGNVIVIVVPYFGTLTRWISPLWIAVACFTIESPSPVPPTSLEWLLSTR